MPLLRLRSPQETPPGYWRFPRHPGVDDGQFIYGGDIVDLTKKVLEYRVNNGLQLGNPEEEIQDWLCRNTGAPCAPARPKSDVMPVKASGTAVARFLVAMASWLASSGVVTQEEADRRAEICAGCRWNVPIDDQICFGCFSLTARIMQAIGNRTTKFTDALEFCGKCGCSLKTTAWAPLEVLDKAHKNSDFIGVDTGIPDTPCWRAPKQ